MFLNERKLSFEEWKVWMKQNLTEEAQFTEETLKKKYEDYLKGFDES